MKLVFPMLALSCMALAQQHSMHMAASSDPEPLRTGLGPVHHVVTTKYPLAQKYFDQGLALDYAFNHHAAERSFRRAAEIDPQMAMAYWGVALVLGPNINSDMDQERETKAFEAIQKAQALDHTVNADERALIAALAARYTGDPKPDFEKLSQAYKTALGEVYRRYPKDDDIATLYAESVMDLRPWRLWSLDGKPAPGTAELVGVLEKVLARNPNHVGANHFYVHALEASPHPEAALESAHRLERLAPSAGHLVHMPSHIFIRTGDYERGVQSNEKAIAADKDYVAKAKSLGQYPMYVFHNFDMLRHAASMEGNYKKSQRATDDAFETGSHMAGMPSPDGVGAIGYINQVRFRKWNEVLARPGPAKDDGPITTGMKSFARGMAFAALKRVDEAEKERAALRISQTGKLEGTSMASPKDLLDIAGFMLDAKIAGAKGDSVGEIGSLQKALVIEDTLPYDEPPDWNLPVRESLGGAFLRAGQLPEAESVFREDLRRNRANGRSLFGLWKTLDAGARPADASKAKAEFDKAWKYADTTLSVQEL